MIGAEPSTIVVVIGMRNVKAVLWIGALLFATCTSDPTPYIVEDPLDRNRRLPHGRVGRLSSTGMSLSTEKIPVGVAPLGAMVKNEP